VRCETFRYQCLENLFSSSSGIAFRSQVNPGDPIGVRY